MTIPRQAGYVVNTAPVDPSSYILVQNILSVLQEACASENAFMSLEDVLGKMQLDDENDSDTMAVASHPLFNCALQEYFNLLGIFLPGFDTGTSVEGLPSETTYFDEEEAKPSELGEALQIFVELTRRRRHRAEKFYHTLRRFLAEYESAVLELEGLSAAEPLLKGTHLSQKIQDLKETVKRKYGAKVNELQKECVNKRRRTNLPDQAVEIFREWFRTHTANPYSPACDSYPHEDEKAELAQRAGVSEAQVSNWFVNVRKRYWKPHAAEGASTAQIMMPLAATVTKKPAATGRV